MSILVKILGKYIPRLKIREKFLQLTSIKNYILLLKIDIKKNDKITDNILILEQMFQIMINNVNSS